MSTPKQALIGNSPGQTLMEILVALGIFSLVLTATVLVFFGGQRFVANSIISFKALQYAHDGIEALRVIRDNDWASMADGTYDVEFFDGHWRLTTTVAPDPINNFTRTITITSDPLTGDPLSGIKKARVLVSWSYPPGTRTIDLYETIAPPAEFLGGDWSTPCVLSSAQGTVAVTPTDIDYAEGKVYISGRASSANRDDLYIFDVSDPRTPVMRSAFNTGEESWDSLAVLGNYVFAVEENSTPGGVDFFVINVSNPAAPVQAAKLTLNGGNGRTVAASGRYVYVGTTAAAIGQEFFVIDVSTPSSPQLVSSMEISQDVNDIGFLFNRAYLATSDNSRELIVVDVATPTSPAILGSYDAAGGANANAVHVKAVNRIYLGRNTSLLQKDVFILDAGMPSAITPVGSTDVAQNILSARVGADQLFLGINESTAELQNFKVQDPANILPAGILDLGDPISGMDFDNNLLYAAVDVRGQEVLYIIASVFPTQLGTICGKPV